MNVYSDCRTACDEKNQGGEERKMKEYKRVRRVEEVKSSHDKRVQCPFAVWAGGGTGRRRGKVKSQIEQRNRSCLFLLSSCSLFKRRPPTKDQLNCNFQVQVFFFFPVAGGICSYSEDLGDFDNRRAAGRDKEKIVNFLLAVGCRSQQQRRGSGEGELLAMVSRVEQVCIG